MRVISRGSRTWIAKLSAQTCAQPHIFSIALLKGDAALRARLWLTLRAVMLVVAF